MDEMRRCKKCGEDLHVVEFRHQKPDYLGLYEICIDCEPPLLERLKSEIDDYCREDSSEFAKVMETIEQIDVERLVRLSHKTGVNQRSMVEHLVMLVEVCIQILFEIHHRAVNGALSREKLWQLLIQWKKDRGYLNRYKNKLRKKGA